MGPKKAPKEITVGETTVADVDTDKKKPKRVQKPKENTTSKDVLTSESSNIKFNNMKKKLIELTDESTKLHNQLDEVDKNMHALCKDMMKELEIAQSNTNNKNDNNTNSIDNHSPGSSKTTHNKPDSDSSKESDNDTNDEESDSKTKVTKVTKGKTTKTPPAKTSRAKGKIITVPVLPSDESDTD